MYYPDTYSNLISVRITHGAHVQMQALIDRKNELLELEEAYASKKAELILIYGRRRVGKTFLIKHFFKKKSCAFFYVTGINEGVLEEQLDEFAKAIGGCFYNGATIASSKTWMKAFEELNKAITTYSKKGKIALFMDEFPWMATKKSRLIQALEYYWNRHWCDNPKIKLIICGSSASWIIKKILYNKGGLHNRTTKQIILKPFTLIETKHFLDWKKLKLNYQQILQIYLPLGGVPFYLDQLKPEKSIAWNINNLGFNENSILSNELYKLFKSLFENHESYLELIRIIGKSRHGISRKELEKVSKKSQQGGRLTERLQDLEMAGFIKSFLPLMHDRRGLYYRIIDEFCYFCLRWIEPERQTLLTLDPSHNYWNEKIKSQEYLSWSGYAFEALCYKHIASIKKALRIVDSSRIGTWRYIPKTKSNEKGTQIDLVFDQNDSIVLFEIKNTIKPFVIDKDYAMQLKQKIEIFKEVTRTNKQVFMALISANGVKRNQYSDDLISAIVTLEDFFK